MLAHVDTDGLGLWEGGTLDLFAESRLGQSIDHFAGTFSPVNLSMFFPVPNQQLTAITGLKFTQAITDSFGVYFGKLNIRLAPGCHLSPDVQFVHPGLAPVDNALLLGLRLKVDF